ncbi:MAG TPA: family 78 glycoside hydrolase catalytic domain [Clostridia bacterium]|nr:family 78 glycoside hydrolase catalytic domain [Clostridia bacterium]
MNQPFGNALWIQGGEACESPWFRRNFRLDRLPASADIVLCGLGYFELYVNGRRIGDEHFVPAWSEYEARDAAQMHYPIHDRFAYRTYYRTYDLLPALRAGDNCLGVWLGNGQYHQTRRTAEGPVSYGFPKLCFALRLTEADGTERVIASDEQVRWRPSFIVENNLFYGETHDLASEDPSWCLPEGSAEGWEPSRAVPAPHTRLMPQTCPPDRVIRTVQPQCVHEDGKRRVYDCGENITGYPALRCSGPEGMTVTVVHSEEYDAEKASLNLASAGGERQPQVDRYRCDGRPHTCHPRFCWHGFRYFEVQGEAEVLEVRVIHADIPVNSEFESSNDTLNWLYDAYLRTQLGNLHGGVPSDCPHRERLGYTGDGQLTAPAAMICLDMRSLYEKWMEDIADTQDPASGHVQHTAPFAGGGGGPGGWDGAVCLVPWAFYQHYGDRGFLRRYLPNMLLFLNYLDSRANAGLVVREEEGGWCLGDWCAPDQKIPEPFVNTYYYIKCLRIVLEAGRLLDLDVDEPVQRGRMAVAEHALRVNYLNPETGSFCGGVNGADAFAVDLGLGDERTLQNLIDQYRAAKDLDTGIFGTDILIDVLFRHGQGDLALALLTSDGPNSFENMRRQGATTIWEHWDGRASHNHPMFGAVVRALFTHVLGIRQRPGTAGYADVAIEPAPLTKLAWAKGGFRLPNGEWVRVETRQP